MYMNMYYEKSQNVNFLTLIKSCVFLHKYDECRMCMEGEGEKGGVDIHSC